MDNNNQKQTPTASNNVDPPKSKSKSNKNNKKVWRTVQVSAGGGPPQGIQMTPEMAAKYIQQAASAAANSQNHGHTNNNSNSNNKKKREVKISFGPSRPTASNNQSNSNSNNHNHNISFAGLDLAALQAAAQAQAHAQGKASGGNNNNNNNNNNNLQCSEAEMKALMGMFVEIMGISMDPEKLKAQGINLSAMMGEMSMSGMNMNMMSQAAAAQQTAANHNHNNNSSGKGAAGASASSLPIHMFGNATTMKNSATEGFFTDGASWEAIRQTYGVNQEDQDDDDESDNDNDNDNDEEDDDDDDDSLPDLDHIRSMVEQAQQAAMAAVAHVPVVDHHHNSQNNPQILPVEWNTMVVEEALNMGLNLNNNNATMNHHAQGDESSTAPNNNNNNNSKAHKKKQKKQQKKDMLKEEAAAKAATVAAKKRERSLLSWTSRVVSACHANECGKLQALLAEHPVEKLPSESVEQHLELLMPNALPSSKSGHVDRRGPEGRRLLATYILQTRVGLALSIRPLRNGRTALHTACFYGDVDFLQQVLERLEQQEQDKRQDWNNEQSSETPIETYATYLNQTCQDSGWAPLHYAVVSGSPEILEILLAAGAHVSTKTDDTKTWRTSDGEGITPRELAHAVQSGKHDQVLESHGTALQEMAHTLGNNNNTSSTNNSSHNVSASVKQRNVTKQLERITARLAFVQANGYSPPSSSSSSDNNNNNDATTIPDQVEEDVEPIPKPKVENKKQKKKKKKQQEAAAKEAEEAAQKSSAATSVASVPSIPERKQEQQDDPMVTALLGMGFMKDQIYAAAKACGGFHRATADDLVVWILGQGADADYTPTEESNDHKPSAVEDDSAFVETATKTKVVVQEEQDATLTEEEVKKQQEAEERLKAKREEKRRRNREWNNREQDRQQTEAQAKMAQALTRPVGADFPPGATSDATLLSPAYPSLDTGLPNALQSGLPLGLSTAAASAPVAPSKAPPIAPTAPTITPTAILKPNREPQLNLGIGNKADFPPMHQSSNFPPIQHQSSLQSSLLNPTSMPLSYGIPPVFCDDDKTVSSLGSNPSRSQSVASNNVSSFASNPMFPTAAAVLPPGFRPPSSGPGLKLSPVPQAAFPLGPENFASDVNSLGEIRASAKAFIPMNFTPAPAAAMGSMPSHGGQAPLTRPYDSSAALPAGFLMGPAGGPSLLPGNRQQSYDRKAPTPLSEDTPPALITAPSMMGIPSLGESSSVPPLPSGLGLVDHHRHHHGSSLLDSISNSNDSGGRAAAPMMAGSSSLWGGPSSFGGLPPFNFEDTDVATGNNNTESNTGLGWGGFSSNAGGGTRNQHPSGQGSIW